MQTGFLGSIARGTVILGMAILVSTGCGPVDEAKTNAEMVPANITDAETGLRGITPEQQSEEMGLLDTGDGLCSGTKVYSESLPDTDVDPSDIPLSAIAGFTLPSGVGSTETRQIFRSAAAWKTFFGTTPPSAVDFSKEWVMFYSAGAMVQPAAQAKIVRVRLRPASLRVTTTLLSPTATCKGFPAGVPYAIAKFAAPALSSCRAYYYHRTDAGACPSVPEPGAKCTGSLTDAGINNIVLTRPNDSIDYRSTWATRHGKLLGSAQLERYRRTCAAPGNCDPWAPLPLSSYLDHYKSNIEFHFKYNTTSPSEIYAVSSRYFCDEPGTGWCYAQSYVAYDVVRTATFGTVDKFTTHELIEGRGDRPINDRYSDLNEMPTIMADRCLLQRKLTIESIGPTAYTETLLKAYVSW